MAIYHEENLLIITKTYPSPSAKYRETSCVAAINIQGQMRRLFPIPYRLLDGSHQFSKWEWIKARITKAEDDHRPESYKIDVDSIERIGKLNAGHDWSDRLQWIYPHMVSDFNTLETRRQTKGLTLGFIRPQTYQLEIQEADNPNWTEEEKQKLFQDNLFDEDKVKTRIPLKKVPYDFYYRYVSSDSYEHRHKITDWEACMLFWNCKNKYGNEWERYFKNKLQEDFSQKRDLVFLMGTIHRFPNIWLIVGLVYPPKVEARQESMFLIQPSD